MKYEDINLLESNLFSLADKDLLEFLKEHHVYLVKDFIIRMQQGLLSELPLEKIDLVKQLRGIYSLMCVNLDGNFIQDIPYNNSLYSVDDPDGCYKKVEIENGDFNDTLLDLGFNKVDIANIGGRAILLIRDNDNVTIEDVLKYTKDELEYLMIYSPYDLYQEVLVWKMDLILRQIEYIKSNIFIKEYINKKSSS